MRVCYLIQSHCGAAQVVRLVETIGRLSPSAVVLVAHDDTGCPFDASALRRGAAEVHYLPVHGPIRRGDLSMLEPYFQGIAWLERLGVDYEWLVYLSGQDYPAQPLARSEAMLAAAECDGFLRFWPALASDTPWGRRRQGLHRYFYRYRELPSWCAPVLRLARSLNGLQPLVHVHLTYGPRFGIRARRTLFDAHRVCYGGWQWTTLRRSCAQLLFESVQRERELVEHYRRTICPDESLVQTVLVNDGRFRLVDDNLRYADTSNDRSGHARVLGVEDLDPLTSGRYHFARKFDLARDPRVLDLLDERLGEAFSAGSA